ncbi:MAG: branched-chain amino acid ABC transporter permease [Lautropia sp.]
MHDLLYQQLANGVMTGAAYAVAAVGLTMVFGVLRSINFAHGEYYMVGAFSGWAGMTYLNLSYESAIVFTVAIGVLLGLLVSRAVMEPLIDAPFQRTVLATLGVYLVLQNSVFLTFGGGYRTFEGGWTRIVEVFGVQGILQRFVLLAVMVAVFAGLEIGLRRTRLGRSIRAVAQSREACEVAGIDVVKVSRVTFCLSVVLAALAGVLMAPILVTIYPAMGEGVTFRAFAVTVIAGLGNVHGVIYSSLLLGITEALVTGYLGGQYREAVGFVALIAVLMWRPWGVFTVRGRF